MIGPEEFVQTFCKDRIDLEVNIFNFSFKLNLNKLYLPMVVNKL